MNELFAQLTATPERPTSEVPQKNQHTGMKYMDCVAMPATERTPMVTQTARRR